MTKQNWTIAQDRHDILCGVGNDWQKLKGAHIFITGGTGFIGRWLLESFQYANKHLKLDAKATVLTRNIKAFAALAPQLNEDPSFSFIEGDVRSFKYPEGQYSHLIHAATDASAHINEVDPLLMFDTIVTGSRRVLNFAVEKSISSILNLSSGAVYGRQPFEIERVSENWAGDLDCRNPVNAYAEGKRASEMLCTISAKQFQLKITSARIFAVLGPYLPLDTHFAAGNFIQNAINGNKIIIKSSGNAVRSYLYISDLVITLWRLLAQEPIGHVCYNVGSDEAVSIKQLAERVSAVVGNNGYEIHGSDDAGWNPGRYVPNVSAISQRLGPINRVCLEDAIIRTAIWNGWKPCQS